MKKKKTGRLTGILFIAATAAGAGSLPFINVLDTDGYAEAILLSPQPYLFGVLLVMLMGIFCAAIALSIYPVMEKQCKGLAIGAAGFRIIEGGIFIASAGIAAAVLKAAAYSESAAEIMKIAYNSAAEAGAMAFCAGALLYYIGFYKTRLVPRWLSIWGIAAILLHFGANISVLFGAESFSTVNIIINMPIALQEMVLAVWLIIFGFNESAEKTKN
ncbi:MAG: DUF4386 domain-containing protein [Clostridia bacterium]|nr:DUF4386 domain-containing protein [Clostridia bacterium]